VLKRSLLAAFALAAISVGPSAALAGEKTVTLSVPSMYCAACPISVRKALEKVPGVTNVKATFEPKEAVVTFDDAKTSIEKLQEATRNAGFPSSVKPGK
jgi:mercuric ion binding protein